MYRATTHDIEISVYPQFLPDRSSPEESSYFWAYTIEITNRRSEPVQLRTRYRQITDGIGRVQEVRGAGVVGEQPVIAPGEAYEYNSGTPLATPSGIMRGSYQMETGAGERFDVRVPAFSLDSPHQSVRLN